MGIQRARPTAIVSSGSQNFVLQAYPAGSGSPDDILKMSREILTRLVLVEAERDAARQAEAEAQAALAELREKERIRVRRALPDVGAGYEGLRPDPRNASTSAELMGALRRFRTWGGNPSFRSMALRSGRRAGASTMCTVLGSDELPARLDVIDAIIEGCGGSDEDRARFATAWRMLALPDQAEYAAPDLVRHG